MFFLAVPIHSYAIAKTGVWVMKTSIIFTLLIGISSFAQDSGADLVTQIGLIKKLQPEISKIGVFLGPDDLESMKPFLLKAQTDHGVTIVTLALKEMRQKISQYIRVAANGAYKTHQVQALYFYNGKNMVTKSPVAMKVTGAEMKKNGVPIYSSNEKGLSLGCLGQFQKDGDQWVVWVKQDLAGELGINLPTDTNLFQPQ